VFNTRLSIVKEITSYLLYQFRHQWFAVATQKTTLENR